MEATGKRQSKASRALTAFLKKNVILLRELQELTQRLVDERTSNSGIHNCSYCPKLFKQPRYVIKHIMQRHPEELLNLHNHLGGEFLRLKDLTATVPKSVIKSKNVDYEGQVHQDFEILRNELIHVLDLVEQHRTITKSSICVSDVRHPEGKKYDPYCTGEPSNYQETISLQSKLNNMEKTLWDLEKQFKQLLEDVRENPAKSSRNKLDDSRILEEIKMYRTDIAAFKESQEQKFNTLKLTIQEISHKSKELEHKMLQIRKKQVQEMKNLNEDLKLHVSRLTSTYNADIEAKFEQYLDQYLKKLHQEKPKRKHNSSNSKSTNVLKQAKTTPSESKASQKGSFRPTRFPHTLNSPQNDIKKLVANKMNSYGLFPGKSKVTADELASKNEQLRKETKDLQCKYWDFRSLYKKLDQEVNSRALSLLATRNGQETLPMTVPFQKCRSKTPENSPKDVKTKPLKCQAAPQSYEFVVANCSEVHSTSEAEHSVNASAPDKSVVDLEEKFSELSMDSITTRSTSSIPKFIGVASTHNVLNHSQELYKTSSNAQGFWPISPTQNKNYAGLFARRKLPFEDHIDKDLSKEVAVEGLEFLRPYKEDLGDLWNQVKDSVKEILGKKE